MLRYSVDEKNKARAVKVIKAYPEQLGFINPEDLLVVRNTWARNSHAIATASLIPPRLEPFLGTKLVIEIYACHWRNLSKEARLIVLFHELAHFTLNERDTEYEHPYAMRPHDVQEFGFLIAKYGVHWQRNDKLPNILKEKAKIRLPEHKMPVMG